VATALAILIVGGAASAQPGDGPLRAGVASANLSVTLSDSPDHARYVDIYASIDFTLTVSNGGPDMAPNAKASFAITDRGALSGSLVQRPNPYARRGNRI
jgi:hypothetical protein